MRISFFISVVATERRGRRDCTRERRVSFALGGEETKKENGSLFVAVAWDWVWDYDWGLWKKERMLLTASRISSFWSSLSSNCWCWCW